MLSRGKQWLMIILVGVICLTPFGMQWLGEKEPFVGTDETAELLVAAVSPDYRPWAESVWKPSPAVENLLFSLQAALGLGMIGCYLVSNHRKKRDGV